MTIRNRTKLAIFVAAAAAAFALCHARPKRAAPAGALAPAPAAYRYRFAISGLRDDTSGTIRELEARVAELPSPFDLGELAELYLRRAQREGDPNDYAAAEAAARRSLALLRTPNGAVLTLAKLANTRHQFRDAIALAREQLAQKRSAAPYVVMATSYLALGELAAAADAATTALAIKPDGNGYTTRALVLQAQGRDAEAAADFAHAASIEQYGDPLGAARLRALWGRFLLRRGELAGAARLLDEALRLAPELPLAVAYQGELALRAGDPDEARAKLEQAFAASRQVRYLIEQARAQEVGGDAAGADAVRAQVEQIVRGELGSGGLGHRLDLVEVLVDRCTAPLRGAARSGEAGPCDRGGAARLGEAIALARSEVAQRPSADARFQLARALGRAGKLDDALAQLEAALATGARDARVYELAAELAEQRGEATRAVVFRVQAERLDPGGAGRRYASGVQ
jgi:Tfp pilus assembly protein PilF